MGVTAYLRGSMSCYLKRYWKRLLVLVVALIECPSIPEKVDNVFLCTPRVDGCPQSIAP